MDELLLEEELELEDELSLTAAAAAAAAVGLGLQPPGAFFVFTARFFIFVFSLLNAVREVSNEVLLLVFFCAASGFGIL